MKNKKKTFFAAALAAMMLTITCGTAYADTPVNETANNSISECYADINEYNIDNFNNNEIILSQTVSENDGEFIIDTLFEIPDAVAPMSVNGTYTTGYVGNKKSFGFKTINGFEETAYAIVIARFEYNPDEDSVKAIYMNWDKKYPSTQLIKKNSLTEEKSNGFLFFKSKSTVTLNFSYTNNLNNTSTHNLSVSCKSTGSVDGEPEEDLYD